MLRYQDQDSPQTLRDALTEYYDANVGIVTRPADLPAESKALFLSHDLCHVIFGLSTTLDDETLADTRTLFSCDVGLRRYLTYLSTDQQAKALFRELGYGRAVWVTVKALPRILRAAAAAFAMPKRWPWQPPEAFMARRVADLRREYGIRVL